MSNVSEKNLPHVQDKGKPHVKYKESGHQFPEIKKESSFKNLHDLSLIHSIKINSYAYKNTK